MSKARRRIAVSISTFVSAAIAICATSVGTATPAGAAPACNGGTEGRWSTRVSYSYAPGRWCMNSYDGTRNNKVVWQSDGNLVWYVNDHVLWATNTYNRGANALRFQVDGNIVIYAGTRALWASGASSNRNSGTQYRFRTILQSNDPHRKWALSSFQTNPSGTLWYITRVYDG